MIRAITRTFALIPLTLTLLIAYLSVYLFSTRARQQVIRIWHVATAKIIGVKVIQWGRPTVGDGHVFVANHSSYLDIPVLGGAGRVTFVAKSEVSKWKIFGFLAKIANTVFIERRQSKARAQSRLIRKHLNSGKQLLFFPEGTSTDNTVVARFKSSLFQGVIERARETPVYVQPVSIAYLCEADGAPLDRKTRENYVWYGSEGFFEHLGQLLKRPGVEVHILFHDPVPASFFSCRKDLARHLEQTVRIGHLALFASQGYPGGDLGDLLPAYS